jgi:hypothetical protein
VRVAAPGVFLLFILFVCVVGLVAYLGYVQARKRREAFAATAARHEWSYTERDDSWTTRFQGAPFGQGDDRRAENILQGSYEGRPFVAFDYRYSTTSTTTDGQGHTQTHTEVHPYSIVAMGVGAVFPALSVSPEGFFGRLVGRLTNKDIELESEDFNRAFTVTCPDRKFASDVLHPQMMEYLLTMPELAWHLQGDWIIAVHTGRHSVEEVDTKLAQIDGIVDKVPEFVWRAVGRPATGSTPPAG